MFCTILVTILFLLSSSQNVQADSHTVKPMYARGAPSKPALPVPFYKLNWDSHTVWLRGDIGAYPWVWEDNNARRVDYGPVLVVCVEECNGNDISDKIQILFYKTEKSPPSLAGATLMTNALVGERINLTRGTLEGVYVLKKTRYMGKPLSNLEKYFPESKMGRSTYLVISEALARASIYYYDVKWKEIRMPLNLIDPAPSEPPCDEGRPCRKY